MRAIRLFGKAAFGVLGLLRLAPAIGEDGYQPPSIESTPPYIAIVFSLVFLIAICAAGFKRSRRTHLD
jgi:hypothetical protein